MPKFIVHTAVPVEINGVTEDIRGQLLTTATNEADARRSIEDSDTWALRPDGMHIVDVHLVPTELEHIVEMLAQEKREP